MLSYATDLTSMTQGRASYSMGVFSLDYVPANWRTKSSPPTSAHGEALVEEEA